MTPFVSLTGIAAPLPIANVDTDMILAAQFLKTITREGLGQALFSAARTDPNFVLNRAPWTSASILIALDNFGCGSSREHAPWALLDFGIRCVIAPSVADIFYNNCFKNGILPIVLPLREVELLMALASDEEKATLTVDLPRQTISGHGTCVQFAIDPARKENLRNGTDEIARSLGFAADIGRLEAQRLISTPWLPKIDPRTIATDLTEA